MIITIDGPSGSGKSTLAKSLAKELQFDYLDTGAHYRAITYWMVLKKQSLDSFIYEILNVNGEKRYLVDGEDVSIVIRTPEVAKNVSEISKIPEVRKVLTEWQREYAKNRNVILDGRDVGSVVFPDATCKFFLIASSKVRAKRRYEELVLKKLIDPKVTSFEMIEKEMIKRDQIDSTREIAPLVKPEGAIEIDTSSLSIRGVKKLMWEQLKMIRLYPYRKWKERYFGIGFVNCHFFYLFMKALIYGLLHIFYKFQIYGKENIPFGKAIIAPNHTSFFDPPVAAAAFSEGLFFLAQEYLFHVPFLGEIIRRLNALSVKGDGTDKGVFQEVLMILEEGRKVIIFPEGARSLDDKLLPFKRGVASISLLTDAPVIPVYINGCYEAWKRGQAIPKPFGRFTIVVGRPIFPCAFIHVEGKKEQQRALIEELKMRITLLKKWVESGAQGSIP